MFTGTFDLISLDEVTIGQEIVDGTGGSILYLDATGHLTENNPGFTYDGTTFSIDSDTIWIGDGSGIPYGGMYTNTTITVVISADSTPTEIQTAGTDFTTGELNLVTFTDHYLTVTKAGRYEVVWTMSNTQNSPSAQIEVEGGVMVNGSAQNPGRAHRTLANSTDVGSMGGNAILDLAANAQVSLYVSNETNTTNIDVEHANLTIIMVGGT